MLVHARYFRLYAPPAWATPIAPRRRFNEGGVALCYARSTSLAHAATMLTFSPAMLVDAGGAHDQRRRSRVPRRAALARRLLDLGFD